MRRTFSLIVVLVFFISCKDNVNKIDIEKYDSQLFKDVQLNSLFKDSKTFTDLVPISQYNQLEYKYLEQRNNKDFDLRKFVKAHFKDHSMVSLQLETDTTKTMYEHIDLMWDKLKRGPDVKIPNSSRIALPKEYVVPGGRFQEIYYWDSYFTMEGLLVSGKWELAKSLVDNFAYLINTLGFIPNGTRDYYNSRSQPPFFPMMVKALARDKPEMILYYLPELQKEYDFFMAHDSIDRPYGADNHVVQMIGGGLMNRYFDTAVKPRPEAYKEDVHLASSITTSNEKQELYSNLRAAAESGWDFSTRWFAKKDDFSSIKTTSILPVDLNCLLYQAELLLASGYQQRGDKELAQSFRNKANQRRQLIDEYFWDEQAGFYKDFEFRRAELMPDYTLAGMYPLFFGIASPPKAERVKKVLLEKFLKPGGLVTTLYHSGQQWDAPNGWAPLQWMSVYALLNYGYKKEAKDIMERWLALNEKVFKNTGKMMEKYNVEDLSLLSGGGEYETQDGFGWTNGVALSFKNMLDQIEIDSNHSLGKY